MTFSGFWYFEHPSLLTGNIGSFLLSITKFGLCMLLMPISKYYIDNDGDSLRKNLPKVFSNSRDNVMNCFILAKLVQKCPNVWISFSCLFPVCEGDQRHPGTILALFIVQI